jgi:hypothetical protein
MHKMKWILPVIGLLALTLGACTTSSKKDNTPTPEATPTVESAGSGLSLDTSGPGLNTGGDASTPDVTTIGGQMPGCSDPSSSDCPVPLALELDGEISAGGVTIRYPTRYFDAATPTSGDILIEITPSDKNKFPDKGTFQVYYADSVKGALAVLTDPITAEWQTQTLMGTIGVAKDDTQDPPITTTIGAFGLKDGRAVVLKAITTGQYGWDLHSQLYEDMLNSLTVSQ